jgi:PAS domain S-box-containing protein
VAQQGDARIGRLLSVDSDGSMRHRVTFEPETSNVGRARQVLQDALTEAGRAEWADAASLALSELVTNAVLHAHTRVELVIEITAGCLRVEVRDFNPVMPLERSYDRQATTGRGMALVSALTSSCGVVSLGNKGKNVWFELAFGEPEQSEEELLAAWGDADDWDVQLIEPDESEPASALVGVQLLQVPAVLWLAARQHHDALLRELVLYLAEHDDVGVDLAGADFARSTVSASVIGALEEAADEKSSATAALPYGHPSPMNWAPRAVDLGLELPPETGPAFAALQDALDVGERLAAADRLLVRPGLPEIVAVRDWVCEQIQSQLLGVPATPWPGTAHERFETSAHVGPELEWDLSAVLSTGRGVVAADDANRIIGISKQLAAQLGWAVEDLVGRRVVTLIPPALRESHVAGFTRHLTTGEAHALGVQLILPVLHADGRDILCRFLIEQAAATDRRTVYLAWIEPVEDDAAVAPPG